MGFGSERHGCAGFPPPPPARVTPAVKEWPSAPVGSEAADVLAALGRIERLLERILMRVVAK